MSITGEFVVACDWCTAKAEPVGPDVETAKSRARYLGWAIIEDGPETFCPVCLRNRLRGLM